MNAIRNHSTLILHNSIQLLITTCQLHELGGESNTGRTYIRTLHDLESEHLSHVFVECKTMAALNLQLDFGFVAVTSEPLELGI
jgi:hypothetical protein